jgi:hypothetical protein
MPQCTVAAGHHELMKSLALTDPTLILFIIVISKGFLAGDLEIIFPMYHLGTRK